MIKTYQYRLLPTPGQETLINKHIGCCRVIWNYFLNFNIQEYRKNQELKESQRINSYHNYVAMANMLPGLKQEKEWLKEVNSQTLQKEVKFLDVAYRRFFDKKGGFPKFKSKKKKVQGFPIPQNIKVKENKVSIPKFQEGIVFIKHRPLEGKIKSATITKNAIGHYFVSIVCEVDIKLKPKTGKIVGIDLGIKDFAITSDGKKYDNPKFLGRNQKKLKILNRKFVRGNYGKKTRKKIAKLHVKIANQRKDFLHKTSRTIANTYDYVFVEDLDLIEMSKRKEELKLGIAIFDLGYNTFLNYLSYKLDWLNKKLIKVNRYYPSSQLCSCCGYRKSNLTLNQRSWTCPECKVKHNRDINAAINIKKEGIRMVLNSSK